MDVELNMPIDLENLSQELRDYIGTMDLVKAEEADRQVGGSDDSPTGSPDFTILPPTPIFVEDQDIQDPNLNAAQIDEFGLDISEFSDLLWMAGQSTGLGGSQSQSSAGTQTPDQQKESSAPVVALSSEAVATAAVVELSLQDDHEFMYYQGGSPASSVASPGAAATPPLPAAAGGNGTPGAEISDDELISLTVKQLNRRLQGLTKTEVSDLKSRRRTLKNRGYAANSRDKRSRFRQDLEQENTTLLGELDSLKRMVGQAQRDAAKFRQERDLYKAECIRLRQQQVVPGSPQ